MGLIKLHIPLSQYEYMEYDFEGSPEEAIDEANKIKELYQISIGDNAGIPERDFQRIVDQYNTSGIVDDLESLEKLNKAQKYWFDVTRRSFARIKNKK